MRRTWWDASGWFRRKSIVPPNSATSGYRSPTTRRSGLACSPAPTSTPSAAAASPFPVPPLTIWPFKWSKGIRLRREESGLDWCPTRARKSLRASTWAKSSWQTLVPRCMTATRSRPCSPRTSIERGYADGSEYLGMVDPKPASLNLIFDHPVGAGLGQFYQAGGDAPAQRRHPGDLGRGIAIRRRPGRVGIAGHQDHRRRRIWRRGRAAHFIVDHRRAVADDDPVRA